MNVLKLLKWPYWFLTIAALLFAPYIVEAKPPQLFVITFVKGEQWVDDVRYEKQPELEPHLEYWQGLYLKEILLMSGPFFDQSGGVFFVRASNLEEVEKLISQDPAVRSKIITATAKKWRVLTSAMLSVKPQLIEVEPDRSFRVERIDPDSPINLP